MISLYESSGGIDKASPWTPQYVDKVDLPISPLLSYNYDIDASRIKYL